MQNSILLVGNNQWLIRALHLLIEGQSGFLVIKTCSIHEVVATSQEIRPGVVLFLPEISLANHQKTLSVLRTLVPESELIVITHDDATLYETSVAETDNFKFISQNELTTALIPKIRKRTSKSLDIDHAQPNKI